ncbi:MAG: trypsin-like serine protease [Deltaproteobacteria bacterium]|nr:trypsin-like serine protease [Deltaproteobacteria bacterium]
MFFFHSFSMLRSLLRSSHSASQRGWLLLAAAAISIGLVGCQQNHFNVQDHRVTFETQGRAIINGTDDTSQAHMAVVALFDTRRRELCSGTLIAPRVVLTAGHCVYGGNPTDIQVFFGTDMNSGPSEDWRNVSEGMVHPAYNPGGGTTPPTHDVALLRLASSAPAGVTPIPVAPLNQRITAADVYPNPIDITYVGFGLDENHQTGVKLTITLPLAMACFGPEDCYFAVQNSGALATPKTLGVDITSGGPCSGDSGGPGIIHRGSTEYVVSVNSAGDQDCQYSGVATDVDGHYAFIQNFLGNGPMEVCEGNQDEDGDGKVDCADPDCANDTSCASPAWTSADFICYEPQKPCPDGSKCMPLFIPNWPAGAGFCSPTCSQPNAPNGECLEGVNGLGICALSQGNEYYCALYCGTVLSEGCPSGFTCRDYDTGATNPEQGMCVPDHAVIEIYCTNGQDDDGDGQTDCDDPDCDGVPACRVPQEACDNGVDDDKDGRIDCADPDCAQAPHCHPGQETCTNGIDDDGDGQTDCDDSDCTQDAACLPGNENCTNGVDDDNDGTIDCADRDCAQAPNCTGGNENCTNGVDDDNDGKIDCADPDCAQAQNCKGIVENCNNGLDDDGDGYIDCADSDCTVECENASGGDSKGCSCRAVSSSDGSDRWPWLPVLLLLGLLGVVFLRRSPKD